MKIVLYGDPLLRKKGTLVSTFDEGLSQTVNNMIDIMKKCRGVGLSAVQVGILSRIIILDASLGLYTNIVSVINPIISQIDTNEVEEFEGCLSFPYVSLKIFRPKSLTLEGLQVDGKPIKIEAVDVLARVIHHEYDHLEGKLFLDRVSPVLRDVVERKIKKMRRQGLWIAIPEKTFNTKETI